MSRETALVTGASSGIGAEFARLLAASGRDLVLVARRAERLEESAETLRREHGVDVMVSACDLSQKDAATGLWRTIEKSGRRVDILVNNAGTGLAGDFAHSDAAATEAVIQLNVTTLTLLCRLALPAMLERKHGRILNVASVVAYQGGGPGMAVYYATKTYVLSLTRSLARELSGSGVTVTALCPGTTGTEFDRVSGAGNLRLFRWLPVSDARSVADAGLKAMFAGSVSVVPGLFNKLLAFGGELPPRRISVEINRILLRP